MRGPDKKPRAVVIRHGLYVRSPNGNSVRDWQIRRLLKKLRTLCPWIELSDMPLARRWCELEVLCTHAYASLRDGDLAAAEGGSRRLLDDYRKLVQTQALLARELGLSPAARMALRASGTKSALDVVAAMASTDSEAKP